MTDLILNDEMLQHIVEAKLVTSAIVQKTWQIHLYRRVYLSISVEPITNGVMYIEEMDEVEQTKDGYSKGKITDLVSLHNYDYDGPLMASKLISVYTALTGKNLTVKHDEDIPVEDSKV